ncbi:MAG TPA: hypothetical protein PLS49_05210 [Candidatus Woesebacteria bacterium]|nr:hypothetical protein [Candidatus Woesebacteria bacterium]
MKEPKKILLVVIIVILAGSLAYLTYLLSNGDSPLGMFNLRASNPQDEVDAFLSENNLAPTTPPTVPTEDPTLLAYNSTSPTPTPEVETETVSITPSVSINPSESPTATSTEIPTPTEFIEITGEHISPTVITELPVAGIGDNIFPIIVGAGAFILLGFLL